MTLRRNAALVEAAIALHRDGRISPDTYEIDLDAVAANAAALAAAGAEHGIELWFVAKQYGRNPVVTAAVAEHLPKATAIDHREADALLRAGALLANVGHLVQIPRRRLPAILRSTPDHVTVVDEANLRAVSEAAHAEGIEQSIIVKILGARVDTYPGQEVGVDLPELPQLLDLAEQLPGVRVIGATGFPCVVFDAELDRPRATATLDRVVEAGTELTQRGISPLLSLPSHTSVSTLPLIAQHGAAIAEPGHALTGTTPQHAVDAYLTEVPAMVYVSEIAKLGGGAAVFGGGFYGRGHASSVLVATASGLRRGRLHPHPAENIDYYRGFDWIEDGGDARLGDTAIMAFRTQIFVTRSHVATVAGISSGRPRLVGVHDALGEAVA